MKPTVKKRSTEIGNGIKTAIENNEQIAIVGDYDVDGIVSSVVISDFFDELGAA